jgi:hypothetical protein
VRLALRAFLSLWKAFPWVKPTQGIAIGRGKEIGAGNVVSLDAVALRFYFVVPHGMRYDLSASFLKAPTIWSFA